MHARIERQRSWDADRGDETRRLDYDLGPGSLVYDVGGYEGNFAADLLCLFGCRVEVFEPIPDYFAIIRGRFRHNPDVRAHRFGLSGSDADVLMTLERGASSAVIVAEVQPTEPVTLRDVAGVMDELGHESIDLMKINIEGGEYDLLDRMIECGLTRRVRHLQIQFHLHVPDAQQRMERITAALERTHELRWRYPWVWESWTLREA
jgi:FkbM family methyltransferase